MTALRTLLILLAAFLSVLQSSEGIAAKPKKNWEMFNACQYVDDKNNDGDSFRVKCGEKEFALRLYFVDAPETHMRGQEDRAREQSDHFGITSEQTLRGGEKAREKVREILKGKFIVWTRWTSAAGRSKEIRYYALVEVDQKNLTEILVSEGLARTKGSWAKLPTGEKSKDYIHRLRALEDDAKKQKMGVWADSRK